MTTDFMTNLWDVSKAAAEARAAAGAAARAEAEVLRILSGALPNCFLAEVILDSRDVFHKTLAEIY